jgi:hypothetical protein
VFESHTGFSVEITVSIERSFRPGKGEHGEGDGDG